MSESCTKLVAPDYVLGYIETISGVVKAQVCAALWSRKAISNKFAEYFLSATGAVSC